MKRKVIVFLSSSLVNIAKLFAMNNREYDVVLILDRKFPFDIEDEELDNFTSLIFDKKKLFEKNKEQFFDTLGAYCDEFEPDFIITSNFTKLLPKSFLDFMKFRNKNIKFINIHHGDLDQKNEKNEMKYSGLKGFIKEFLEKEQLTTTLHLIENEKMDEGEILAKSFPTTLKDLKQKHFFHHKEDILSLRLKNVALSYHERTKVLKPLAKILETFQE